MNIVKKYIRFSLAAALMACLTGITASCDDQPDEFEPTGGVPTIKYVRTTLPQQADSMLTSAYMESVICIVGNNLKSVHEIWFNDQKASLNTSYITDNTIIVAVPGVIPEDVTNKIYFKTSGGATVDYDFKVLVPGPVVNSMSNEWAKPGEEVTLVGNYFIDDANVPLEITMPGNVKVTDIKSVSLNNVTFTVPADAVTEGPLTVKTIYGTSRSTLYFHDTRGMLFDWDGTHGGLTSGYGWRSGTDLIGIREDIPALDGNYFCMDGTVKGDKGAWPDEDKLSFNYWPQPSSGHPELSSMFDATKWDQMILKFEVYVPASVKWVTNSLNMIFSSNAQVTYDTATNGYFTATDVPRGIWTPWRSATGGFYNTADRWVTVSLPLSGFTLTHEGGSATASPTPDSFTGLTFLLYPSYIVEETEFNLIMAIDNIRVVPNK